MLKLHSNQMTRDLVGHTRRYMTLTLRSDQTPQGVLEEPSLWEMVQHNLDTCVRRGDLVTVVATDGCTIYDSCFVTKAQGGSVWLGKPARIVTLENDPLWEDAHTEIVPVGTGYAVRNKRTGHTDAIVHRTVDAAKSAYMRTLPKQVA